MNVVAFPEVPQAINLHARVDPGTHFSFSGRAFDKNFSVSLTSHEGVALKLDFDLEATKLVKAKAQIKGIWTPEVKRLCPVKPNESFSLHVLTNYNEFHVEVNGRHVLSFPYKLPVQSVTGIFLHEYMEIDNLAVDHY